jgi:hypothetical protein
VILGFFDPLGRVKGFFMGKAWMVLVVAGVVMGVFGVGFGEDGAATKPAGVGPVGQTLLIEAETFEPLGGMVKRIAWGENDYKANFANANLSRQAGVQLGKVTRTTVDDHVGDSAFVTVNVPEDGVYRLLVRYEAPFGFDYGFEVKVRQGGKEIKRSFGRAESKKLWPFGEGMKPEVVWDWGANENIVWEGSDFEVPLKKGEALLVMAAENSSGGHRPQANRNIDCVVLTSDVEGLKLRLEKETNMPLASWLTQKGDLWARVTNKNEKVGVKVTFADKGAVVPGHAREPVVVNVAGGGTSEWVEVGGLLSTFAQGRWTVNAELEKKQKASPEVVIEFSQMKGVIAEHPHPNPPPEGEGIRGVRRFEMRGGILELAYEPNIRDVGLEKGIKPIQEVLYGYLSELEKVATQGKPPVKVPVSAISFAYRPGDTAYNAKVDRFNELLGINAASGRGGARGDAQAPGGVIMPFSRTTPERIKETLEILKGKGTLGNVSGFMIGSETANNLFPGVGSDAGFRAFLKARGVSPEAFDPDTKGDWERVTWQQRDPDKHEPSPSREYYRELYGHELRIAEVKKVSDALKAYVPEALVAINFNSYMVPSEKGAPCLGPTYSFARVFREKALTLPWIQDYMFWMPNGFHGMQFLNVDLMRAGIRHYPKQAMAACVMPQSPGNNPRSWRRMFYGHMAHGVNRFDLFQIAPIQVGNQRYHVTDGRMFAEIRRVTHELGTFEDLLLDSKVAASDVGFYFSEHGDALGSWHGQAGLGKGAMYGGLKLANAPVDVVIEEDLFDGTLDKYKVLVVSDFHVSPKAVAAMKAWTEKGGLVVGRVDHGMYEGNGETCADGPYLDMLGCKTTGASHMGPEERTFMWGSGQARFYQQEMMNQEFIGVTEPFDRANPGVGAQTRFGMRSTVLSAVPGASAVAGYAWRDNGASIVATKRADGSYKTLVYGFSPGLQGFKSDRPMGRYDDFQTPGHMTVTQMLDGAIAGLVGYMRGKGMGVAKARVVDLKFIETGWVESKDGVVVPVIDWGNEPVKRVVRLELGLAGVEGWKAFDQSGKELKLEAVGGKVFCEVEVDGAGAVVLRRK